MFVVDASVALAWCFSDETSAYADGVLERLEGEEAVAPAIWPLEIANGLRTAERRARIDPSELLRVRELLRSLPVRVETIELEVALGEVLEVARAHDLSAYDAAYLALAVRRGLALATADDSLRRACKQAGVDLAT